MARLSRETLILFGGSGATTNFAKFGSQAASAPIKTKDIPTIQSLTAWLDGWQDAVALGEAPYIEDMNGLIYVLCYELVYSLQEGIPEWDNATVYNYGSVVKSIHGGSSDTYFYISLSDSNTNNVLPTGASSNANWAFLYSLTGVGLIIPGTATNDSAPSGMVGEYISNYGNGIPAGTTAQFKNITSISLTPGDWDVTGLVSVFQNGSGVFTAAIAGVISLFSGNVTTDHKDADNLSTGVAPTAGGGTENTVSIPAYRISLTTTTTVYLKGEINYSSGSPLMYGRISARRVR